MELSLEFAQEVSKVAHEVGKFQMGFFRQSIAVSEKGRNDLVTEIDRLSEEKLYHNLSRIDSRPEFFGEEYGSRGQKSDWQWVVDPIDGTTNFLSGLDVFSISIGLCFRGVPKLGVVHRPYTGDTYLACENKGAYLNNQRLSQPAKRNLSECLIATGFPFKSSELYQPFFEASERVLTKARDMRRCGSAALDLCFLATGVFGGFWELDLNSYDIAGALPLLSELGFITVNLTGDPYVLGEGRFFLAAQESVFNEFFEAVAKPYQTFFSH